MDSKKFNFSDSRNAVISILGTQDALGEDAGVIEVITPGFFFSRDGGFIIRYDETEPDTDASTTTVVTVERPDKITVVRCGEVYSQMIFEEGRKHLVHYDTKYGSMTIGISTRRVNNTLDESGGDLEIDYALEIDSALASENTFKMKVRSSKPQS